MSAFDIYCELDGELDGSIQCDERMSRHTTFRVGGPAALFIECATLADISKVCTVLEQHRMPWAPVGKGSNLLVSDKGCNAAIITLGNEFKPENMLDYKKCQELAADGDETAVAVSLKGSARSILNFCRDNDIPVRGHVLVWHSQTPGWFFKKGYDPEADWVDKETMLGRMENYIKNVFAVLDEEYPDVNFYAWDVVNEAWNDGGQPRKAGTYEESGEYSGWVGVFGDNSFIPYAFKYARKYARKDTKL